uniref:Retrovirus-related Pol polyprotein from transposon TNT 1-94 n=1 Tax=Tanacetum cinerariifolium TaxID=118510 RepID=A0A6L2MA26_TANCI|nr:retrovirus-related Pol polyprotein from transposon TNT 1-94 [Tanacetum cinerariifolium]
MVQPCQKTHVLEGVVEAMPITSAEDKAQRRLEVKVRSTLIMGIPNEHQLKFNSIKDAKLVLEVVEKRFGFTIFQSNSPQLAHEDLQQIHPDDIEEMDLRWQMAMLTVRAERFLKNTKRRLTVNTNENIGFNKSKVECYNCHKTRQRKLNKNKESSIRNMSVETPTSTALVSCGGLGGYDWSDQAEKGINYALVPYSSSSSDSDVSTCFKSCLKTVKLLKAQNDQLLKDFKKSELMVLGYKIGNCMPLKLDLSFIGLEEFVNEPVVEIRKSDEKVSDSKEENVSQTEMKTVKPSSNPQMDLQDKRVIDSGCSRHMKRNMSYLIDYEEIDGGYDAFGGNSKGGKITGKEADSTACYVQNKVLVVKPHNKTPYELFHGRTLTLSFMRLFGCPIIILNTIDHLGKFDGKVDEGFFVGYSLHSKAFRVFNNKTRIVEENLHIRFSETTPNVIGSGPNWLFDIDALTKIMNYEPIIVGTKSNGFAGTKASTNTGQSRKDTKSVQKYMLLPLWNADPLFSQNPKSYQDDGFSPSNDDGKKVDEDPRTESENEDQEKEDNASRTNNVNTAGTNNVNTAGTNSVNTAAANKVNTATGNTNIKLPDDPNDEDMDKSAFLYGKIEEEVYVCQPLGFKDLNFSDRVYKVKKALYGLHQAPRAWQVKRGQDTKIPQSSGPPTKVDDEAVYKEWGDKVKRAATTASSFEAEHDNASVSTLENGEIMIIATIDGRVKTISEASIRRHLKLEDSNGINSLPNAEIFEELALMGILVLENDLKQTKKVYSTAITKLIMRVKKLEHRVKIIQHRRRARVVISDDEVDLEDPSKKGRKIDMIDQDPSISLVQDEGTSWFQVDAETQEKQSGDTKILFDQEETTKLVEDFGSGEKGEKKVSTPNIRVSTANVSIAKVSIAATTRRIMYSRRSAQKRKDKGKAIVHEFNVEQEARSKSEQEQERIDFEAALNLQEQLDEREEVVAKVDQAHNIDWSDPAVIRQSHRSIQVFEDMLKNFNSDDLVKLWSLVQESFNSPGLTEDKEKELWVDLKMMFEPDEETLLELQRYMYDPLKWWLYDTCSVHHVFTERGQDIFILVEKDFPLTKGLATVMLCNKLRVDRHSKMYYPVSTARVILVLPVLIVTTARRTDAARNSTA